MESLDFWRKENSGEEREGTDCSFTNILVLKFYVSVRILKQASVCKMNVKFDFM